MNTFITRAISGLLAASLFIAAILYSQYSYGIALLIAVVGAVYEFYTITGPVRHDTPAQQRSSRYLAIALTIIGMVGSWALNFRYVFADISVLFPALLFIYFVKELFTKNENPFQDIAWHILPLIYILLPVMLINWLYFEKGELFALAILFIIWFYDSMCYICGSVLGRTKLFERISPKKTVEGLLGGMVLTLLFVFFLDRILGYLVATYHFHASNYHPFQWLFIGLVTVVFATFGDLVESLLKRSIGIKDSGSILPGHGGFLDRFDAILVAIPFSVVAVWIMDQVNAISALIDYVK